MARKSNFTDAMKAAIYARDRATCVYSGDNLWIFDGGANPHFTVDWADHVIPVTKGGLSIVENGVCAGWNHNKKKSDSLKTHPVLFVGGEPAQPRFDEMRETLRPNILEDLARFKAIRQSDWYFNRALFRVLLGVDYLMAQKGKRDDRYYACAALKAITRWRKAVSEKGDLSIEDRGLAPTAPSQDQKRMLSVREVNTVDEILAIMKDLLPLYSEKK